MAKMNGLPSAARTKAFDKSVQKITDSVKTQRERFLEAARQLGCDEDEAAFDEKLKAIAQQKPKDEAPKSDK